MAVTYRRAIKAKNQNGIYDSEILCAVCDGLIGQADKWFAEAPYDFHSPAQFSQAYEIRETALDANWAARFAISVIYRASLSNREHFRDISLGPYEQSAGKIATGFAAPDFERILVLVNVLTSPRLDTRQFAFYPVRCANGFGRYFIFTLSGVQFLVKFGGKRKLDSSDDKFLSTLALENDQTVNVTYYPFADSAEAEFLMDARRRQMFGFVPSKFSPKKR